MRVAFLVLALAVGCAKPTTGTTPMPTPGVPDAQRWPLDLSMPLPDEVGETLSQYKVILIGETHGTQESPSFVYRVVKALTDRGYDVRLALEVWKSEQKLFDEFMTSGDVGPFTSSNFFTSEPQDGRASTALIDLLTAVRALDNVEVVCADDEDAQTNADRDRSMAEAASEWEQEKRITILVAGSFHTSLERGSPWNPAYKPAGYLMQEWYEIPADKILALLMTFDSGTYWACFAGEDGEPDCKVQTKGSRELSKSFILVRRTQERGHNGRFHVTRVHAATPFVQSE